jgi:glycosyltransferase involved in cell wall biosynthesis
VTIHDLNHLIYGSWSKRIYYQTLLRSFALRSTAITTVSEFSKREISNWLKIPEVQIEVVYNSLGFLHIDSPQANPSESILKKQGLNSGNYFFCLSNSKPHKNLSLLVTAYQNYRRQNPHAWPLVMNVHDFSMHLGIQSVGPVSGSDSSFLLANAGGMLFPSLYEGFGLPPIEAALFGIPLAVSRIPPHEEGLIDLSPNEVSWIAPNHLEGWTHAFQQLQNGEISPTDPLHRNKILNRFNTERIAQHMDQIYRRVLRLQT